MHIGSLLIIDKHIIFLHVNDFAKAILFIIKDVKAEEMHNKGISQINVGS